MKLRTIITQDAEVDDQNSLRHFLFYANEVELQGIVQTSSKFHWRGKPGTTKKSVHMKGEFDDAGETEGDFDKPYRWTGTDWMFRVIDDYEQDYPSLCRRADGYPTPDYLRSITKVGNVAYKGETETPTEGSELIRRAILADDDRPLYLQVWGGCNTIARALMDIQAEFSGRPDWETLHSRIMEKVVITACGEQDETYRTIIAEDWPRIRFVKTLQMLSYAYPWYLMPDSESRDCLSAPFMKQWILKEKSALARGYCTWLDGKYYEGEPERSQFGANPDIIHEWFGAKMGLPEPQRYDFLSEGDSPTFFTLFGWGMRGLEDFTYGSIGGRYAPVANEYNSKGEALNLWDVAKDAFTDRSGQVHELESMWPFVAGIQRDFAARIGWAAGECDEHAPTVTAAEGTDLTAAPGAEVTIHAQAVCQEDTDLSFRIYQEPSAPWAKQAELTVQGTEAHLRIPADAQPGTSLHLLITAQSRGLYRLTRYCQVILTVQ